MNGFTLLIIGFVLVVSSAIFLESYIAKKRKMKLYTISDSVVNLSCGMLERIFDFFYAILFLQASTYIFENWAPYQISTNIFSAILALLIFDFLAYWHHRWSHEVNFLWAAHIVHHQSEELNLTTVFRVSFLAVINRSAFFIWMPFIGFDAFTILICGLTLGLYQLFTHSRLIGKLGFLELFMTTPSHHRVHHGRNESYMDHNYGHIFIFWDKLFGTFIPETEEVEYGITSGFESTNPYTAQFSYWKNLFTRAKRTKKLTDKVKVFLKGPAWTPDDVEHLPSDFKTDENGNRLHHKIIVSKETGIYILINSLFTFLIFIALLKGIGNKDTTIIDLFKNPLVMSIVGVILISLFAHGKMFNLSKQSITIDAFRLIVISVCVLVLSNQFEFNFWLTPLILGVCGIMFIWLMKIGFQMGKSNKIS